MGVCPWGTYPRTPVRCGGGSSPPPASTPSCSRARARRPASTWSPSARATARAASSSPAEYGIGRVHDSYEALLGDDDVEAVYIPLPNSLHVQWSIKALEAGKHVLCEKPLTRRAADAEAAFDAAERAGRLLMEAFMWRYHPQTEALVRLAEEIAPLRVVRAAFGFRLPDEDTANVRLQADLDGGALMDVGCYCVSALRLLCGEPDRVERRAGGACGRRRPLRRRAALPRRRPGHVRLRPRRAPARRASRWSARAARWSPQDPWHGLAPAAARATARRFRSRRPTRTGCELEDFSAAIREGRRRGSAATTRSARHARSRCSTPPRAEYCGPISCRCAFAPARRVSVGRCGTPSC